MPSGFRRPRAPSPYYGTYVHESPAILPEDRDVAGTTRDVILANAQRSLKPHEKLTAITHRDTDSLIWYEDRWTTESERLLGS